MQRDARSYSGGQVLGDCAYELFRAYSVLLRRAPDGARYLAALDPRDSGLTAARVELRSGGRDGLPASSGKLLLVSTFDFISQTLPRNGRIDPFSVDSAGDWLYIRDWTRELTNQLASRLTQRLEAVEGVSVAHGPPQALGGDPAVRELRAIDVQLCFTSEGRWVFVGLALPPDLDRDEHGRRSGGPAPGTITLLGGVGVA